MAPAPAQRLAAARSAAALLINAANRAPASSSHRGWGAKGKLWRTRCSRSLMRSSNPRVAHGTEKIRCQESPRVTPRAAGPAVQDKAAV